ncbi:MAG: hypothetical protein LBL19_02960 [Spirochaetaceae bacterium]|nr:hypothetical protein [Spirochaetaceae bacterium]
MRTKMKTTRLFWVAAVLLLAACGSSPSYSPPPSPPSPPPALSYSRPGAQAKWANVTYTGEDEPLLEGTIWEFPFLKGAVLEFRSGGRLVSNLGMNGTWQRTGDTVEFVIGDGFFYFEGLYEGIYDPESQRILGTAYASPDVSDQILLPASSPALAAPAPAPAPSTINVYVTPPASSSSSPARNAAPAASRPATKIYGVMVWYLENGTRKFLPFMESAATAAEAERNADRKFKSGPVGLQRGVVFLEAVANP